MFDVEKLHVVIEMDGGIEVGRTITRTPICDCTEVELVKMLRVGIPYSIDNMGEDRATAPAVPHQSIT